MAIISRIALAVFLLLGSMARLRADENITAVASSDNRPAALAVDKNVNTSWESKPEDGVPWLVLVFNNVTKVRDMVIHWGITVPKSYAVLATTGGSDWNVIAKVDDVKPGDSKYIDMQDIRVKKVWINCLRKDTTAGITIDEVDFIADVVDGVETGVIHESVACNSDPEQTYALYLPKSYGRDRKSHPAVFGFSPDGRGSSAVKLLTDSAEKNGFILIGVNNARTVGWESIRASIEAVLEESLLKYRVDPKNCFAFGFSGGAKISFYANEMYPKMITGVIPCCGGFPDRNYHPSKALKVYGFCGNADFNNDELKNALTSAGWPNNPNIRYEEFNGGHEWPPKEKLEAAMDWMLGAVDKPAPKK